MAQNNPNSTQDNENHSVYTDDAVSLDINTATRMLKEFDGKRENVTEFVDNCKLLMESIRKIDRVLFFKIIKTKLTGRARDLTKYRNFETFENFTNFLEQIFSEQKAVAHWQLELANTKQIIGESVVQYANKIEKCLSHLIDACTIGKSEAEAVTIVNLLNQEALNVFLQNLQDPLKLIVKALKPNSLESAIDIARNEEKDCQINTRANYNQNRQNFTPRSQFNSYNPQAIIRCNRCGKREHIARDCKTRFVNMQTNIVCSFCKKPGHHINNCFKRQNQNKNSQYSKNGTTSWLSRGRTQTPIRKIETTIILVISAETRPHKSFNIKALQAKTEGIKIRNRTKN